MSSYYNINNILFHLVLIINLQSQSRLPRSGASEQELEKKIDAIGADVDAIIVAIC